MTQALRVLLLNMGRLRISRNTTLASCIFVAAYIGQLRRTFLTDCKDSAEAMHQQHLFTTFTTSIRQLHFFYLSADFADVGFPITFVLKRHICNLRAEPSNP